jgi:hypothetical protein
MKLRAFSPILAVLGFFAFGFALRYDFNVPLTILAVILFGAGIIIDVKTRPKK